MAWTDALGDWLLGQKREDVDLPPELDEIKLRRKRLAEALEEEGLGEGPTEGEMAIRESGREAIETAGRQARSRAAGARGFSKVLADIQAGSETAQVAQQIAGETNRLAAREREAGRRGARQDLAQLAASQEAGLITEEALRDKLRRGGLLPGLLATGGAAVGGYFGGTKGAALGAQIGGTTGAAFQR